MTWRKRRFFPLHELSPRRASPVPYLLLPAPVTVPLLRRECFEIRSNDARDRERTRCMHLELKPWSACYAADDVVVVGSVRTEAARFGGVAPGDTTGITTRDRK